MTAKPKENPLYGKFDEVVEALVRSPPPDEGAKVEEGQPASPPARQPASPPARQPASPPKEA